MIQKLYLSDFRNFETKLLIFSAAKTVIVGPNASGKTNILEALQLLSTGKSFKANVEAEMIRHDEELARVKGLLEDKTKLEVVFTRGEISVGDSPERKRTPRKRVLVNGIGKRLNDFAGIFKTVLFTPGDVDLVTESPSDRRKFLDTVLSQVDREYRRALGSYEKGLRQRNRLLFRIREEGLSRSQLLFWNQLLIKNGDYLARIRAEFIDFANATGQLNSQEFTLEYDKSAISEHRLEQYADEEVAAATTLVGPHRDDFIFFIKKNGLRELDSFGSRGEQRMGVLWLKLAELAFIEKQTGDKATLLLDDIFSELDHQHRDVVMEATIGRQAVITTADPHFVEEDSAGMIIQLEGPDP